MKPLTLIGEGMLVTVGAVIPGGVLPPVGRANNKREQGARPFIPLTNSVSSNIFSSVQPNFQMTPVEQPNITAVKL